MRFVAKSMRKVAHLLGVLQPWFRTRTGSEWHRWKARAKLYNLFCYRRGAGEGKAFESGSHSVLGLIATFEMILMSNVFNVRF